MLGARIAALRREAGWNQAELARRLRISPSAVGMYEQGRREPPLDTLVALSRELGVTVDYLLTGQAPENTVEKLIGHRIAAAEIRFADRKEKPFTRQELAILFAAMLLEEDG